MDYLYVKDFKGRTVRVEMSQADTFLKQQEQIKRGEVTEKDKQNKERLLRGIRNRLT